MTWCRAALLLVFLMSLSAPLSAAAVAIAEWDLANATGQSAAVLSLDANLSATPITPSAGVTAWGSTAQDGFVAASGWATSTPDPARYYEWSITAAAGFVVDYTSITLALFRGVSGGLHGADLWDLHASTDAFASSNLILQTFDISSSGVDEQILFAGADISAIGTVGNTVTFRLYGYDYTATSDFSGLGNDSGWAITGTGANPFIDGAVSAAVPEPGTGMLVWLGMALLGARQRATKFGRRA